MRKWGTPSAPRRNTTPPADVSRWARGPRALRAPRACRCSPAIRSPLEHAEREVPARVRLDVGQQLPQLDHRERRLLVQRRIGDEQAERAAAVRDAPQHAVGRDEHPDQALLVLVRGLQQVLEVRRRGAEGLAGRGGVVEDGGELPLVGGAGGDDHHPDGERVLALHAERASMNCRTTASSLRWISATVPTWRTRPSYNIAMRSPTV